MPSPTRTTFHIYFYPTNPHTLFSTSLAPLDANTTLAITSARLRPLPIATTFPDAFFRHRKLHTLYRLANYTALSFGTLTERFGRDTFASSREKLPYAVFSDLCIHYAPLPLLAAPPAELVCTMPPSTLVLDLSTPHADFAPHLAGLALFVNDDLHRELSRSTSSFKGTDVEDAGPLYAAKYVLDVKAAKNERGDARLELTTRRSQDHERIKFAVQRYAGAKLRRAAVRARVPRGREWQVGAAVQAGYGTWVLLPPGMRAWKVKLEDVEVRGLRHPRLAEMYLRP